MLTVAQLNTIRERVRRELMVREPHGRLVVGVGTLGLSAGAREVIAAAMNEVSTLGLDLVVVGEDLDVPAEHVPVVKYVDASGEETIFNAVSPEEVREIIKKLSAQINVVADA
jgi:NADP-reducing hydrogenase subunit HndB